MTHKSRNNSPLEEHRLVLPQHQHGRLRHAVRVALLVRDRDVEQAAPLELLDEEVVWVDDRFARVSGRGAHCWELRGCLSSHDHGDATLGADAGSQALELLEVGHAEGTPVASVVCGWFVRTYVFMSCNG
jgi:hypothetical protein